MAKIPLIEPDSPAGKPFWKLSGGGNDFVVFDHRERWIEDAPALARRICTRRLSVGADGLILLERSSSADVRMVYFNSDGSRGEFCGNGTRCVARMAFLRGVAPDRMTIETDSGIVTAVVDGESVTISLAPPTEVRRSVPLRLEGGTVEGSYLRVGVPHFVLFMEGDLWARQIESEGMAIRSHAQLQPDGANVDFVHVVSEHEIEVRTWERGVEAETFSCGSGVTASAIVAAMTGRCRPPIKVLTRSGIELQVAFAREDDFRELTLTGDARVIFEGTLTPETLRGFDAEWARNPTGAAARP